MRSIPSTVPSASRPVAPDWNEEASDLWYEGALLGNGDLGAVVFGASNQVIFALGKNDFWDRRYYMKRYPNLSYQEFMKIIRDHTPEEADRIRREISKTPEPVPQGSWPSPKPVCRIEFVVADVEDPSGTRTLAPITHRLSLERAELLTESPLFEAVSRVQKNRNLFILRLKGAPKGSRLALYRNTDTTPGIAPPKHGIEDGIAIVVQDMPPEDTYPQGFRCAVAASLSNELKPEKSESGIAWTVEGERALVVAVATTRDASEPVQAAKDLLTDALIPGDRALREGHLAEWKGFWDASWIRIDDRMAETLWYVHNYLLACAARPGAVAPGLFGPWIVQDFSAWRGSYTMDYNFEQAFAAALSCNHPELLEPYLETIENMLPAARQFARDLFETEGIAFPHEMFPIDMRGQGRGSQVYLCETPWAVQHFWECYDYTRDGDFLKERAYPIVAACADLLANYAKEETNGKYVFEPTRSPEHHGLEPGLPFNRNGTPELGFARYIFRAAVKGASLLGEESQRTEKWEKVLKGLPDYPRGRNQLGEIFLDCEAVPPQKAFAPPVALEEDQRPSKMPGNHGPWMTYNVPTSLLQVWPAGQVDMDSPTDLYLTAVRTWHTAKFEGSNELIIRHMAAARLGIPTLEELKREVRPRLLPNGSIACQMNPLFEDTESKAIYRYRANGVYLENLAYPLVINEMMLQSHNDLIRLFPTLDYYRTAEFHHLRARGGFLVSAAVRKGFALWAEIAATVDGPCRVRSPWPLYAVRLLNIQSGESISFRTDENDLLFDARGGVSYRLEPGIGQQ